MEELGSGPALMWLVSRSPQTSRSVPMELREDLCYSAAVGVRSGTGR